MVRRKLPSQPSERPVQVSDEEVAAEIVRRLMQEPALEGTDPLDLQIAVEEVVAELTEENSRPTARVLSIDDFIDELAEEDPPPRTH